MLSCTCRRAHNFYTIHSFISPTKSARRIPDARAEACTAVKAWCFHTHVRLSLSTVTSCERMSLVQQRNNPSPSRSGDGCPCQANSTAAAQPPPIPPSRFSSAPFPPAFSLLLSFPLPSLFLTVTLPSFPGRAQRGSADRRLHKRWPHWPHSRMLTLTYPPQVGAWRTVRGSCRRNCAKAAMGSHDPST